MCVAIIRKLKSYNRCCHKRWLALPNTEWPGPRLTLSSAPRKPRPAPRGGQARRGAAARAEGRPGRAAPHRGRAWPTPPPDRAASAPLPRPRRPRDGERAAMAAEGGGGRALPPVRMPWGRGLPRARGQRLLRPAHLPPAGQHGPRPPVRPGPASLSPASATGRPARPGWATRRSGTPQQVTPHAPPRLTSAGRAASRGGTGRGRRRGNEWRRRRRSQRSPAHLRLRPVLLPRA